MANIKGTNIASLIAPFTTDDAYPTHDSLYGKGGYKSVNTIIERNNIPVQRLTDGCVCYVVDEEQEYRWNAEDAEWVKVLAGLSDEDAAKLAKFNIYDNKLNIDEGELKVEDTIITNTDVFYPDNLGGYNSLIDLDNKVKDLERYKFPNVTLFGEPTINNGQISGFSVNNYAQFPFLVDFRNQAFEINMCFTTGPQARQQENIFDSIDGLAFAVRERSFVIAMSSDGVSWNMGEHVGDILVTPNTTYYVKFSWNRLVYSLQVSTDGSTYTEDIRVTDTRSLFAKQIIIGKSTDNLHIFGGSINLNYCSLSIRGQQVWQGMDDVGLATRLATDLSNIDEAGINKIQEIAAEGGLVMEFFFESGNTAKYKFTATQL